jgi:hypothetical protein
LVTRLRSLAQPARGALADHHGDELALVVYELLDGREALARGTAGEIAGSTRRPGDLFRRFRRSPASTEIAIP